MGPVSLARLKLRRPENLRYSGGGSDRLLKAASSPAVKSPTEEATHQMVIRIGTFRGRTPEQAAAALHNLEHRFAPALAKQPGFVAAYWATAGDGTHVSISVWESREALQAGAARANAEPLLPGQVAELIPSPDEAVVYEVEHWTPSAAAIAPS